MKVLDDVLELLKDGEWHRLQEIQDKMALSTFNTQLLINFLISYGFCDYRNYSNIRYKNGVGYSFTLLSQDSALRLKDNVKEFFEQLNKLETDVEHLKNV